ncbi:hypothetical protein Barb6_00249 [Bacteroidales bacterium Barb6]|nr:hypothetical protein Barb6_00249 [Bacteroidales bacterium Barb6]
MKSKEEELTEKFKVVKLKLQSAKDKSQSLHQQIKSLENKLITSKN